MQERPNLLWSDLGLIPPFSTNQEGDLYHIYVTRSDEEHVSGSVINGDGKEYAVGLGDGYVSCECPDFCYRKTTCKHLLAMALQVLRAEGVVEEEPEERPVNLKLTRVRKTWQGAA